MIAPRTLAPLISLLALAASAEAQAPVNDSCSGAVVVSVGVNPIDNAPATTDGSSLDPMVCLLGAFSDDIFQDVWFLFTAPSNDLFDIELVSNGAPTYDGRLAIYDQSSCPDDPALVLACDDDAGAGLMPRIEEVPLANGNTYLIRAGTFDLLDVPQAADLVITLISAPPAVPNDDCSTAAAIGLGLTPFDSRGAADGSAPPLDPMACSFGFGDEQIYQDVWFSFSPPVSGSYDFEVVGNGNPNWDSRIAIYPFASCPLSASSVLDCDDDGGADLMARLDSVALNASSTYLIRVGSFDADEDEEPAALSVSATPGPPTNDDCSGFLTASLGLNALDTRSATDGSGLPLDPMVCSVGGTEQLYADAWYRFTATTTANYDFGVITNGNPTWDSRIAIYAQSSCPDSPLNVIACDDDGGPGLQALTSNVFLTSGSTVTVRVGSFSPSTISYPGALEILLSPVPPANDDCANAQVLTAFGSYAFDNTLATTDGPDLVGFCDYSGGTGISSKDVWFEYTPAVGGCTYISTLGLVDFDSRIAIYTATACPVLASSVLACSDDEVQAPISFPFEAGLDIELVAGSTYLIQVGNWSSSPTVGGAGQLLIAAGPAAAANDMGLQSGAPGCTVTNPFPDMCNGDGGDQMGCTDCPCFNNAPPGTIGGCANSASTSTRLMAAGDPSISLPSGSTTDLVFTASGAPPSSTNVLISGAAVAPQGMANPCFGQPAGSLSMDRDGLRCAVQALVRHGNRSANGMGDIMDPSGPSRVWGGAAQPVDGIGVQGGFVAGQTRFFQITHRDDAMAVCMRGLNTSQAVEVTFTP